MSSIVISSVAISSKQLGAFLLQPEQHRAGRGEESLTLLDVLTFVEESIFGPLDGGIVDREGDFLRRELSFGPGSGVTSF